MNFDLFENYIGLCFLFVFDSQTLPQFIVTFMKVVKSGEARMEEKYVSHIEIKS